MDIKNMESFWTLLLVLPLLSFVRGGFSLAPWVPAKKEDLLRIHTMADLSPGQTFYELGCGDARVCHFLAKKNPEATVVGFEITWIMYFIAKMRLFFSPVPNLSVYKRDIFWKT
jgi:tRNA G46 methylase TrmB